MTSRVQAIVKPDLLTWARKSSGLDLETAAGKVRVREERLKSWEQGESRPTVKQLRKLARAYKRPLALFYLPEPPRDFQPMHDFRRLPGEVAGVQSPELRYEIRRAINRRQIAIELCESPERSIPEFRLRVSLTDEPESLARRIRKSLRVSLDTQKAWQPGYDTFNNWRTVFERAGVLVFQMTSVDVSEIRGFSISELPLPVVVVNTKDSPAGRCFTMVHELAHIMLRKGGLCDLDDHTARAPEELRAEVFCNMVAGCVLVPGDALLAESIVRAKRKRSEWSDDEVLELATAYGVSREVVLRRLLLLGRTTQAFYRRKRHQYNREAEMRAQQSKRGFPPPYRLALSRTGPTFARLVLNSYHEDRITVSDVADLLEVRLKHLDKIEEAALAKPGADY